MIYQVLFRLVLVDMSVLSMLGSVRKSLVIVNDETLDDDMLVRFIKIVNKFFRRVVIDREKYK